MQDINKIQELIPLYFNGETTSEEEKYLYDFFLNHTRNELPEDLKVYYDLFLSLSFFSESPPQELIEKIETPHLKNNTSNLSSSRLKLSFWLSLSAAVFLGIIILLPLFHKESRQQDYNNQNMAVTAYPEMEEQSETEIEAVKLNEATESQEESSGYVEIKDINEAVSIISDINNKITSLMSYGKEATNIIYEIDKNMCQSFKTFKTEKNESSEF